MEEDSGFWLFDSFLDLCTDVVIYVPTIFRVSAIALLFMFMWAVNIYGFDKAGIPFRTVLGMPATSAQFSDVMAGIKTLSMLLISSYTLFEVFVSLHMRYAQLLAQMLFWIILVGLALLSEHKLFKDFRGFMAARLVTLWRCREVKFIDVLVADVLTSMSKLLADMRVVGCAFMAILSMRSSFNDDCLAVVVAPTLASIPYAIRAVQCWVAYRNTQQRAQLLNLGKYLSAFPVIWTSALKHQLAPIEGVMLDDHDRQLQVLWLYTVTINTIYSFLWDVLMDWGLCMQSNSKYPFLRDKLLYGSPAVYYLAIIGDLALRLCWSLKLSSHLQHHASGLAFIFLFEILEVFRRFVWNFFRVEWQVIVDEQKKAEERRVGEQQQL